MIKGRKNRRNKKHPDRIFSIIVQLNLPYLTVVDCGRENLIQNILLNLAIVDSLCLGSGIQIVLSIVMRVGG
mgnify:CR=1 FL=1